MATEYKITYTYTGQDNTSASRSVALSKFKKSGDITRKIGQIKSITYEHWHTSTKAASWALRGRLVLSDGTMLVSDTVTKTISGSKVKYTNTFTNLPTPEQFALLKTVQTLDSKGKTTSDGYSARLYWRANSDNPMKLIVTFVEEKPVMYAPKIDAFGVVRCDASGNPSEEGQYIRTSLKLSIGNSAGLSGASCKIYYGVDTQPVIDPLSPQKVDLDAKISTLMTGVTNSPDILTGVWSVGNTWFFTVVFTAGEETAVSDVMYVERGTTSLHISGAPGGGVCVGGFSTGTTDEPKFESRVPAFLYGGINGVTIYSSGEVDTGGKWIGGKPIYRYVWIGTTDLTEAQGVVTSLPSTPGVVVALRAMIKRPSDNAWLPVPNSYYSSMNYMLNIRTNGAKDIVVGIGGGVTGTKDIIVIAEYTKA